MNWKFVEKCASNEIESFLKKLIKKSIPFSRHLSVKVLLWKNERLKLVEALYSKRWIPKKNYAKETLFMNSIGFAHDAQMATDELLSC